MDLLRKFQLILPMPSLLTLNKTFIRNQLDMISSIIPLFFLESIQVNSCLAITGAIGGTLTKK